MKKFSESKKEKSLEECPSFKDFNDAIQKLKTLTKKIGKELNGTKGEIDDYIEKKIFGRDV